MTTESALIAISALAAGAAAVISLRTRGILSVHALGRLEGSLPNLKSVVVVAHYVEAPNDELRRAVETNLIRGVKYRFLISKSNAERELHGYIEVFLAIARVVSARVNLPGSTEDLVEIRQLSYDWEDVPYIFYEMGVGGNRQDSTWIAYEGTQKRNGIADQYVEVPVRDARRLAKIIQAGAPTPIRIMAAEISEPSKIIPIERARRHVGQAVGH